MTSETVTLPTLTVARLVAGHVDNLWSQWANDKDVPGCCPQCCGPCAALKDLLDHDQLDALYGAYVDQGFGEMDTWDASRRQVGRDWLLQAWAADIGCGHGFRACGCMWKVVPVEELSDCAREAVRPSSVERVARFSRRCAEHDVMCRSLEDWEIHLIGDEGR